MGGKKTPDIADIAQQLSQLDAGNVFSKKTEVEDVRALPGLEALRGPEPAPVVVGRGGQIHRGLALGCLAPSRCLRRQAIMLVESAWFDPFVLVVIMCK